MKRLRGELQLGWLREVFPGATHSRWSHTLGVFATVCQYYNALLSDPEIPTVRILINDGDIEHALIAAILHDIGQTAFGHDLEVVNDKIFGHERVIPQLLNDTNFGLPDNQCGETLGVLIGRVWSGIDTERVLGILGHSDSKHESRPIDGLARDIIDGHIDADKLDYVVRDSVFCGVPYGSGLDRERFLRALTVQARRVPSNKTTRLTLAYRAKGAAAVESLLFARYQMYGSVYWHHTYRCIQAMMVQAAATAFSSIVDDASSLPLSKIRNAFYEIVVCKRRDVDLGAIGASESGGVGERPTPPQSITSEPALEFVWVFAASSDRRLLERIAERKLYKRVYERRTAEIDEVDYSFLQEKLSPRHRPDISRRLQDSFLDAVLSKIEQKISGLEGVLRIQAKKQASKEAKRPSKTPKGNVEKIEQDLLKKLQDKSEDRKQTIEARRTAEDLNNMKKDLPLVVLDYPIKGIPDMRSVPLEIGDATRKYISGQQYALRGREVFARVRRLQIENAAVRVFAEPALHQLIVRYLDSADVLSCVLKAMPFLESQSD